MSRKALVSVFYKDGLEPLLRALHAQDIAFYSTGGTQTFIESLGLPCTAVEDVTGYPSILGGRVKTLHPKVFGGILARRNHGQDGAEVAEYDIPLFDVVIVDLYPFEETVQKGGTPQEIIEKIDIGGVSLIRAAAKNFESVCIVASQPAREALLQDLSSGQWPDANRSRAYAAEAFKVCALYDQAISNWFAQTGESLAERNRRSLRYGENPHQQAWLDGNLDALFTQHHGKELSYNNLVDLDATLALISDLKRIATPEQAAFAIIKHTNPCGAAIADSAAEAWEKALAGDRESAFGGVLACSAPITASVAQKIQEIFFEVVIAPGYEAEALEILKKKKNRIILELHRDPAPHQMEKEILGGMSLVQSPDTINAEKWEDAGARPCTPEEKKALEFANVACKHLKSNAIALAHGQQLIGKGCGQTSRIDALRQALEKARQMGFDTQGAVLASDAFFPFDDCVRMAHKAGITAIVQPGGSVRDADSISFVKEAGMAMVLTGTRHFRH